jgi:maltooligosyltrehalose trehalohydrolase
VDPSTFRWNDQAWKGIRLEGQVLYELHVGAFTPEGTYAALERELPYLKELGITTVELMPLNTFPGRFNWGYDGVAIFAPCAVYGKPDELRHLIDRAHALGLGIVLDVVYNHFGPDGNYLSQFSDGYFTDRYPSEWGAPVNFDGENAGPSRDFFLQNACAWLTEYHFDGLRFDATQNLFDASKDHICTALTRAAREATRGRDILLIAENEPADLRCVTPLEKGGHGMDLVWVDDFHHSARVGLSGKAEAYTHDYRGTAQELLSCARQNSLFQGQYFAWQKKPRGTPLRRADPKHALFFLQNHDQIANQLLGQRLHVLAGDAKARALTMFWLLLPQTPMFFMGQESFARRPFLFFVDHNPELQALVAKGRSEFLSQFETAKHAISREGHRVPIGEDAFALSRLGPGDRERNGPAFLFHQELLRLRREDPVFHRQDRHALEGAILGEQSLVLRWFGEDGEGDRLLFLNLATEQVLDPCPEPLLAPPPGSRWKSLISSEEVRFGGRGAWFPEGVGTWTVSGASATLMTSTLSPASEQ